MNRREVEIRLQVMGEVLGPAYKERVGRIRELNRPEVLLALADAAAFLDEDYEPSIGFIMRNDVSADEIDVRFEFIGKALGHEYERRVWFRMDNDPASSGGGAAAAGGAE